MLPYIYIYTHIYNLFIYFCSWFRFFWIPLSHLYSCLSLCSSFVFLSGINLAASLFLSFLISSRWILIFSLLFSIAVCQKRKSSSSVCLMVRSALSFFYFYFLCFLLISFLFVLFCLFLICFFILDKASLEYFICVFCSILSKQHPYFSLYHDLH